MKQLNAAGPEVLDNLPKVRKLPPKSFQQATADDADVLIDTRMMLAFGGGHIKGALNIGGSPTLFIWAGWLLDPLRPTLLVLESDEQLHEIVRLFLRTGYTKFAGYPVGGMRAWNNAGLPLEKVGQMTVHEIGTAGDKLQLLDVRSPAGCDAMLKPAMQDAINAQINAELHSAYRYMSMAAYFESINLKGFANWMRVQTQEKTVHALKLYGFICARGGRVKLTAIAGPEMVWQSPLAVFAAAYAHEQKVTALINGLVDLSVKENDHATSSFLQWFVNEQVEEEANADGWCSS